MRSLSEMPPQGADGHYHYFVPDKREPVRYVTAFDIRHLEEVTVKAAPVRCATCDQEGFTTDLVDREEGHVHGN